MTSNLSVCGNALHLPYADGIAQVCVTSPPYYALRSYLHADNPLKAQELGTEQTPAAYVAQIVAAMREVWRVLRDDGTLWLNLGSSFSSASSGPSRSLSSSRVPAYGSGGIELPDSQGLGSVYSGLCDEHLADFRSHLGRIADTYQQTPQAQRQRWMKDRGIELPGYAGEFPDVLPLSVLASTTLESWRQLRGECSRCASREDALSGFGLGVLSGPESARNLGGTNGKTRTSRTSGGRTSGREPLDLAWGDYTSTIKAKDLIPTPWMVAMALQADGWYLRRDIIWAKPSAMPESVLDRPTSAHEYVFLLSKAPRYFYDAEAIREDVKAGNTGDLRVRARTADGPLGGENQHNIERRDYAEIKGANARSVWTIATQPFSGAHFATMVPELARRCILAGSSARGQCPKCGAPWTRVIEKGLTAHDGETDSAYEKGTTANRLAKLRQAARERGEEYTNGKVTTGWAASCACDAGDPVPQLVLDPFSGSGTTAMVALQNGRRAIGTELNPAYILLQQERTQVTIGLGF